VPKRRNAEKCILQRTQDFVSCLPGGKKAYASKLIARGNRHS